VIKRTVAIDLSLRDLHFGKCELEVFIVLCLKKREGTRFFVINGMKVDLNLLYPKFF